MMGLVKYVLEINRMAESGVEASPLLPPHSIGRTSLLTVKGASVLDWTSSTVTPSASSMRVRPLVKSTSNTHWMA